MSETPTTDEVAPARPGAPWLFRLRPSPDARRLLVGLTVATAVLVVLAFFYMDGAATNCRSTIRGAPGDGTSGGVWLNWVWGRNGGLPFDSTQQLTGAGRNDALWQPVFTTNSGWSLPMYVLSKLGGPVCGYNLVIMLGYVTSGLGMWLLGHFLTRSRIVSTVAAVVFAYSGFTQVKSEGHISGVFLGYFPLLVLTLLWMWKRPSMRRALVVSVVWSAVSYVDGYYLPFALVLVAGAVLAHGIAHLVVGRRASFPAVGRMLRWTALAGLFALVLLAPLAVALLSNRGEIGDQRTRTSAEAATYAARPLEYLVPPAYNPVFDDWSAPWRAENLHGSNSIESTIYLGWGTLILAATAVVVVAVRARRREPGAEMSPLGSATVVLVGIGLTAFVTSLSPEFQFFGLPLPMPAGMIRLIFPEMRVFSRLFVVVHTAAVALAAIGLAQALTRLRRLAVQRVLAAALACVLLTESLAYPADSIPVWSYSQAPRAYVYLHSQPDVRMVARYPLETADDNPDKTVFTFQPVMNKVFVNPIYDSPRSDDPSDIARGLASLGDPQTVPALRALGADTVLVERQILGQIEPSELEALGLTLRASFDYVRDDCPNQINGGADRWAYLARYYDVDIYAIDPGPVAPAVVALGEGWWGFEARGSAGSRWMDTDAQLTAVGLTQQKGLVSISFTATAFARTRTIEVHDGATVLATLEISVDGTPVTFDAPVGHLLTLHPIEPADVISSVDPANPDDRRVSISVYGFSVETS